MCVCRYRQVYKQGCRCVYGRGYMYVSRPEIYIKYFSQFISPWTQSPWLDHTGSLVSLRPVYISILSLLVHALLPSFTNFIDSFIHSYKNFSHFYSNSSIFVLHLPLETCLHFTRSLLSFVRLLFCDRRWEVIFGVVQATSRWEIFLCGF